jgi:hypothetical protein
LTGWTSNEASTHPLVKLYTFSSFNDSKRYINVGSIRLSVSVDIHWLQRIPLASLLLFNLMMPSNLESLNHPSSKNIHTDPQDEIHSASNHQHPLSFSLHPWAPTNPLETPGAPFLMQQHFLRNSINSISFL